MKQIISSPDDSSSRPDRLGPAHGDLYCDHLMRLDAEDRRFRFFGDVPDFMLALHAGAAVADGRYVVACACDGEIRGAAELLADSENPEKGELAFTVEREWRRRGLAQILMRALLEEAARRGMTRVELEIMADNDAMQKLAGRFTEDLRSQDGSVFATIAVDPVAASAD